MTIYIESIPHFMDYLYLGVGAVMTLFGCMVVSEDGAVIPAIVLMVAGVSLLFQGISGFS